MSSSSTRSTREEGWGWGAAAGGRQRGGGGGPLTVLIRRRPPSPSCCSVYTYHNRKWLALQCLAAATGDALWQRVADRLLQLNAFVQVTDSAADDLGGIHEAIADPWLARGLVAASDPPVVPPSH